jgi:hypothetical protein
MLDNILEGLHYEITPAPESRWEYFGQRPTYKITGKYLFFSLYRQALIDIAEIEIGFYDFDLAKINTELLHPGSDWVLCIYWKDNRRKFELATRYRFMSDVNYRYWKSDERTKKGIYSGRYINEQRRNIRSI